MKSHFFDYPPVIYTEKERWDQIALLGSVSQTGGFGFALSVGDFDGDSSDDLAVGIPGWTVNGAVACGQAHVIYGSNTGLTSVGNQEWNQDSPGILDGCEQSDQAGRAMGAGDFDKDGHAELVIGVPQENGLSGLANIIPGSSTGVTAIGNMTLP